MHLKDLSEITLNTSFMNLKNYYENKTIMITGASGLIGSNLARQLFEYNCKKILLVGRNIAKLKYVFGDLNSPSLSFIEHDINCGIPSSYGNVDYIFHAASPISGQAIKNEPVSVISSNLYGIVHCIDYLKSQKECKGCLVVFSSATVYENTDQQGAVYSEENTEHACSLESPVASYAESKRMIEVIAKSYVKQFGLNIKIARIGYVYGYSKILLKTAFFDFIRNVKCGENIIFQNTKFFKRDNIYIDDVIDGILHVAVLGSSGESYNVSSGGKLNNYSSIYDMAQIMIEVADNNTKVETEDNVLISEGVILNNEKLCGLGWAVKTDLFTGIKTVFDKFEYDS